MRVRTRLAAALATAALLLTGGLAQADTLDDLQGQRAANEAEQERLASELEGTDASLQTVYLELTRIEGEIPVAQAELDQAEEDLAAAERHQTSIDDRLTVAETEAETLTAEIETSQLQIEDTEDGIGELARSTYRGGDGLTALHVVFDAATPEDFATRTSAVNSALRAQGEVLDELETTAATQRNSQSRLDAVNTRIAELKVEADAAVVAADDAREAAEDRRSELDALKADESAKKVELEGRKDDIATQQTQIAADNATLDTEIQAIFAAQAAERARQAEEKRKADEAAAAAAAAEAERQRVAREQAAANRPSGGGGGGAAPAPAPAPAPPPASTGGAGLIPPVPAPFHVTSPFGMRIYPMNGGRYMHNGTDIRSACGNPQVSAGNGRVVGVKPAAGNGTHGNQVLIDHGVINGDSYVTVYNHLSRFAVSNGQSISQGQALGYTGMTGAVTGCHVHVEVWRNGTPMNPEDLSGWNRTN